ncbi:MAG TPA: hypothetical protein VLB02_02515 [Candidatus Paceibacterota bacterium]|nr:hypothetical protein [Candidatus Paceibacterota bacterium]
MKNKNTLFGAVMLALSVLVVSSAYAQESLVGAAVKVQTGSSIELGAGNSASVTAEETVNADAKKSAAAEKKEEADKKEAADDEDDTNGETTAAAHRSAVAIFVQELLKVADRERGIGAEVRVIAQEQQASEDTTTTAVAKVETRSKIKTFFFGTDYKTLGTLRSEMVKTEARIIKLKALIEKATSATAKATLTAQLEALQAAELKIQTFIEAHENTFSLFGWAAKKK